jgi:hypothetical protein
VANSDVVSDDSKKALPKDPNSMLLKPDEAMCELRVSRATLFKLLRPGPDGDPAEIDSFLIGPNARRIPRASLNAYVARKLGTDSSAPSGDVAGEAA